MKNGNGKTQGNGHGGNEVGAAIHDAPGASPPFFSMTRLETARLYQALSRATFPDAEVRALVSRMGQSLGGDHA
jgi:dihydroxyacetone kinase